MSPSRITRLVFNFVVLQVVNILAGPIVSRQVGLYQTFTLVASHSTSPIHFQPINANNLTFWIGKPTSSFCFDDVDSTLIQCPQGNITALDYGGYGAALNSQVPAGQAVFVASNGALGFTRPHGLYYPDGAFTGPFNLDITDSFGLFTFTGDGSTGWLACPIREQGPWQVFAAIEGLGDGDVPGGCVEECIGFSALTSVYDSEEPAVFQYE
ncbi:MAG: hypothetical protein Q9195_005179 [Heterodermia aff. obscurata]